MNTGLSARALTLLALVSIAAGCGLEPAEPPDVRRSDRPSLASVMSACQNSGTNIIDRCWPDFHVVSVGVLDEETEVKDALDVALADWKLLLDPARDIGHPRLSRTAYVPGSPTQPDMIITMFGSNAPFCGFTSLDVTPGTIRIYSTSHSSNECQNKDANTGSLRNVLKHELGHVLGWTPNVHKKGQAGISDNCSMFLDTLPPKPLRPYVCLHDAEGVFRVRRALPVVDLFAKHIVQRTNVGTQPVTLQINGTHQLQLSEFRSDPPPSAYLVQLSRTSQQARWQSAHPSIASVSATGQVTGHAAGTTWIRALADPVALPPQYVSWSPLELYGDSVKVTVEAPPADTVLRILSITAPDAPPITTAGPRTFTAIPAGMGPYQAPVEVRWEIDYSTTGIGVDDVQINPGMLVLEVAEGSYEIRLTATPRQVRNGALHIGAGRVADFPVCTGGGGGGNGAQRVAKAPPGTDAVGGC